MDTHTTITYSYNNTKNNITKGIEYKNTIIDDDKIFNTTYTNLLSNDGLTENYIESFNKLLKDKKNIYEQIGNSKNNSEWNIKEFENNTVKKEYKEPYNKFNFKDAIINKEIQHLLK